MTAPDEQNPNRQARPGSETGSGRRADDPGASGSGGAEPPLGEQFDFAAAWRAFAPPTGETGPDGHRCVELCPICRAADLLRAGGAPELRGQLTDLQREALLTLRSLIDHYVESLDREPSRSGPVEQIPID